MGWRKKTFQKKINHNPFAKELEERKYRQRIKESDKDYSRKKLRIKDVHEYEESSD